MYRYFTDFLSIYLFLQCASRQQKHGNDPEIMETRGFWFLCTCIVNLESPRSFKVLNETGKPPRRTSRKSSKSPDGDFQVKVILGSFALEEIIAAVVKRREREEGRKEQAVRKVYNFLIALVEDEVFLEKASVDL